MLRFVASTRGDGPATTSTEPRNPGLRCDDIPSRSKADDATITSESSPFLDDWFADEQPGPRSHCNEAITAGGCGACCRHALYAVMHRLAPAVRITREIDE